SIFYPALAMFLLTAWSAIRLARLRIEAARSGAVDPRFYRLFRGGEEPDHLRAHARHFANLFEAPLLFHVILVIAHLTGASGMLPLLLAWAYVVLRYAHSWVHLTSNRVVTRFRLFAASWAVLVLLWLVVFAYMASGA